FPDRVAQLRGERGSFRLAGGGGARMARTDRLANTPLLAVAALEMKDAARIRLAAPLALDSLPDHVAARLTESVELGFDPELGAVIARRRRRLGALVLSDRTEPADPEEAASALAGVIGADPGKLPWTEAARQLQARVALMRGIEPGIWPDLSDAALGADLVWLRPHLYGLTRLADVAKLDLSAILHGLISRALTTRLERELPTHLTLPGGRAAIDYTEPVPIAAARAQAFYGMDGTPALAGGRVPLRLALLSPAGRPAAITADLARFWTSAWAEVRKEMRGRYPKHNWPENGARP
ncbi:MAG: ATP-dependent helicase HrpB, partial [Acetobacteraceae bacterium]|nr:ATP-dependent helicase HrpB [Acetobacteraceae bacterium]